MQNNKIKHYLHNLGLLILWVMLYGMSVSILWNLLMPGIFNLPYINFWQACGLNLLTGILFRSANISKISTYNQPKQQPQLSPEEQEKVKNVVRKIMEEINKNKDNVSN